MSRGTASSLTAPRAFPASTFKLAVIVFTTIVALCTVYNITFSKRVGAVLTVRAARDGAAARLNVQLMMTALRRTSQPLRTTAPWRKLRATTRARTLDSTCISSKARQQTSTTATLASTLSSAARRFK